MNNIGEEDDIKNDDTDDRNGDEPITVTHVHPAVEVFILLAINHVRYDEKYRCCPTNNCEA